MKCKIVFVALLVEDTDVEEDSVENIICNTFFPLITNPRESCIYDYAYNCTGQYPALPEPIEYWKPDTYEMDQFMDVVPNGTRHETYVKAAAGTIKVLDGLAKDLGLRLK